MRGGGEGINNKPVYSQYRFIYTEQNVIVYESLTSILMQGIKQYFVRKTVGFLDLKWEWINKQMAELPPQMMASTLQGKKSIKISFT